MQRPLYVNIEHVNEVVNQIGSQIEPIVRVLGAIDGTSRLSDVANSAEVETNEARQVINYLGGLSVEFEISPSFVEQKSVPTTTISGDTLRYHAEGFGIFDALRHATTRQKMVYGLADEYQPTTDSLDIVSNDLLIRHSSKKSPFTLSDGALNRVLNMCDPESPQLSNEGLIDRLTSFVLEGAAIRDEDWALLADNEIVHEFLKTIDTSDRAGQLRVELLADDAYVEVDRPRNEKGFVSPQIKLHSSIIQRAFRR